MARLFRSVGRALLLALALTAPGTVAWAGPDSTAAGSRLLTLAEADSVLGRQHFYYSNLGRRDPFASLLSGEFQDQGPDGVVDLDQVKLVGIMWGDTDRFALVEDTSGYSYILRVGDRVRHGSVIGLEDDKLVAEIRFFGMTRKVVLTLEKE